MDRLTSLTAFVRVVEAGGFSAAGRKLNMSTTMVSNHVQALEERLGVRLLNRPLGPLAPLVQDPGQRAVNQKTVKNHQQKEQKNGRHGAEQ